MLTLGKDPCGSLVSIDTQWSGKGLLVCPFCDRPLVAVRGRLKIHHFRHDGATCRESKLANPLVPGWDHFHLSFPPSVIAELIDQKSKRYYPTFQSANHFALARRLERYKVFDRGYLGCEVLTETAQVVPGLLSLRKFDQWFRNRLKQCIDDRRYLVVYAQLLPMHLALEATRQGQIFSATLCLLELKTADGGTFYKIGRTRRPVSQRLAEVIRDMALAHQVVVSGKILKEIHQAGYIEKYALWRYRASDLEIGRYQEYLQLQPADLRKLKSDLTRFANERLPLSELESALAAGTVLLEQPDAAESPQMV